MAHPADANTVSTLLEILAIGVYDANICSPILVSTLLEILVGARSPEQARRSQLYVSTLLEILGVAAIPMEETVTLTAFQPFLRF